MSRAPIAPALARRLALGLAMLLAACGGGNGTDTPDDPEPDANDGADIDAGVDAAALSRIDQILALLQDGATTAEQLDEALLIAAREASWPLHEGDRWLFARAWADAPGDAALTGDWVGFAAGALPATAAAIGDYVYVLLDEGAGDAAPSGLYKWWSSAGGYQAPPEATVYGYDEFGEYGRVQPPSEAHLQRFPGFVTGPYARTIRLRVPAFGLASRVLVMHDGQNVFDPDAFFGGWHADETLAAGSYGDVLAVAIDNTPARFDEYTQVADLVAELGDDPVGGQADAYLAMIDDEVLPFVRARFGVAAGTDDVAMVGSSLGGLVTLYAAHADPDRARCSIGMSSTLGWGSFGPDTGQALVEQWDSTAPASVVITAGGDDGGGCFDGDGDGVEDDANDGDNYCVSAQLVEHLDALGYTPGTSLAFLHAAGAQHNEASWAAMLPDALAECVAMGWVAE
jgi:hypothetical protein